MRKLKVGFVSGFMVGFSDEGLKDFEKNKIELIKKSKELDFELYASDIIITDLKKATEVRRFLEEKQVDFVLLFHPSYIIGDYVFELMKFNVPFGLWAIEEIRDEGPMPCCSMVNVSQNAGIATNNFKDLPRKYKWFFGKIENRFFIDRFEITIKALKAINILKGAKVAQIGKLADGHINHMVDPRLIYKNLKVDVSREYEVEDIISLGEKMSEDLVNNELDALLKNCKVSRVGMDKIKDSVKLFLAIKKISEENDYSAVAFSCWPKLMPLKEMTGCLTNSMLNSIGIPAGCEGDILSTISMLVLKTLTDKPVALMDLAKFDFEDNSLLLWHCGSAPIEMANKRGCICEKHYFADYDEKIKNCGPTTDIIFKKGDVSVFRFFGEGDKFYYFTGEFFNESKKSFSGSRGWVNELKFFNEPVSSLDLANTFLMNGLPHHYPMVLQNVSDYIEEMGYWLGLKRAKKIIYRDYLYI
ncbi:MAG: hypothetical protein ACYDIA_17020 [Candidatus Humimicrobiaceae bacterium]